MAQLIPKHLTQPKGAIKLLVFHSRLDIAAWKMISGEQYYIKGIRSYAGVHGAVEEVKCLAGVSDAKIRECIQLFHRISL